MMLLSVSIVCLFVLVAGQISFVQIPATPNQHDERESQENCPRVSVSCPSDVKDGELMTFTADVSGGNPNVVPVFSWEVFGGRIVQGQGTSSIKVDLRNFGGQSPTGTVTISGFDSACARTASCSLIIEHWDLSPKKFDSYGALSPKEELSRLNAFAVELKKQPGAEAYLLAYGARRGRAGEALKLAANVKEDLVKSLGIDARRIVTLDAGYREELTIDLWIVATGHTRPVATPTVDPSEVKITPIGKRKRSKH